MKKDGISSKDAKIAKEKTESFAPLRETSPPGLLEGDHKGRPYHKKFHFAALAGIPSSSLPLLDFMAEHRVYLSLFGFCACLGYAVLGIRKPASLHRLMKVRISTGIKRPCLRCHRAQNA